ncbi:response regulator transcription factor [Carboxylicivirga sp. N1Y90]|uniref:response regulator transcription factor n=1 Tax=Carboxylicivirga fragile TaxID=3417571 RepID=UPI003D330C74|nr:helix-turn-helix transcriptional regulator [Marinilabiliaceae bacterium N1Y90]
MVNILVADQSYIITSGFSVLLEQLKGSSNVSIVSTGEACICAVEERVPDVILLGTTLLSENESEQMKGLINKETQVLYLFNMVLPVDVPVNQLSIVQSKSILLDKLQGVLQKVESKQVLDEETEGLSPREKSILKCVALGLTNKEIGEKEFISTHTVISHRKNITRKLGIKTVSGLTVYSIINNIIEMNDIN